MNPALQSAITEAARRDQTIALSLISHTNAGKTTLARTLLGRDVGEVRDAAHVTLEATPYPMIDTPDGATLMLWDTPGFGDSARLAKRLAQQGNPIGWFLSEVWDRFRDRAFYLSQQAVRNVREQADVVLYLVNASEAPGDAGYLDPEMRVLAWIGKPVVVLLNQTGRPRGADDERAQEMLWRQALAERTFVRGVVTLDAFARCWVQEIALLDVVGDALPEERRAPFARLAQAWQARRLEQFAASMAALARPIAYAACDREVLPDPGMRGAWRDLGRSLGLGRDDGDDAKRRASAALASRLDAGLRESTDRMIALHQLEGHASQDVIDRLAASATAHAPVSEGKAAMMGGLVSGALTGLAADLAAGGLTFGAGVLAGALMGALGGAGIARGMNLAKGQAGIVVRWNDEILTGLVRSGILRYLAVAHYGRGRGGWVETEYPPFWVPLVAQCVDARGAELHELWRAREPDCDRAGLEARLAALLSSTTREVLERLYPGTLPPAENLARHGPAHRVALGHPCKPAPERRAVGSPGARAEAEVEIAQRGDEPDLPDVERRRQTLRLALERVQRVVDLRVLSGQPLRPAQRLRTQRGLVAREDGGVHDAVGQRMAPQRLPARFARGRKHATAAQRVEVLADHRRIVELAAVVAEQRGHLHQRVVRGEVAVGRVRRDRDRQPLDAVPEAHLVGDDGGLAGVRRGGGVVELHRDRIGGRDPAIIALFSSRRFRKEAIAMTARRGCATVTRGGSCGDGRRADVPRGRARRPLGRRVSRKANDRAVEPLQHALAPPVLRLVFAQPLDVPLRQALQALRHFADRQPLVAGDRQPLVRRAAFGFEALRLAGLVQRRRLKAGCRPAHGDCASTSTSFCASSSLLVGSTSPTFCGPAWSRNARLREPGSLPVLHVTVADAGRVDPAAFHRHREQRLEEHVRGNAVQVRRAVRETAEFAVLDLGRQRVEAAAVAHANVGVDDAQRRAEQLGRRERKLIALPRRAPWPLTVLALSRAPRAAQLALDVRSDPRLRRAVHRVRRRE